MNKSKQEKIARLAHAAATGRMAHTRGSHSDDPHDTESCNCNSYATPKKKPSEYDRGFLAGYEYATTPLDDDELDESVSMKYITKDKQVDPLKGIVSIWMRDFENQYPAKTIGNHHYVRRRHLEQFLYTFGQAILDQTQAVLPPLIEPTVPLGSLPLDEQVR